LKITTSETIAIVNLKDKSYVVPLWLEVPQGTSLSDIEVVRPVKIDENPLVYDGFMTGSKGDEYQIKIYRNGKATCECWGYRRHKKDCKHIRQAKSKIKEG
tara:strand:+ start:385 stop:687 length:303 start_codon:yes stop_codon:yes gene_type:complete